MTLLWLVAAWLAGLALGIAVAPPPLAALAAALLAAAAGLLVAERPLARVLSALLAVLALGVGRGAWAQQPEAGPTPPLAGAVEVRGVVAEPPRPGNVEASFRLELRALRREGGGWEPARGGVLARARGGLPAPAYGDLLEASGRLREPPARDGGRWRAALRRQGVVATFAIERWRSLGPSEEIDPLRPLLALRTELEQGLARALPPPHVALVAGLLFGGDRGLPTDLREAFQAAGVTHILAVSGFNIAIVTGVMEGLAVWAVGRRWAWVPALVGVAGFTALVGAPASALRAAAMGAATIVGHRLGRLVDPLAMLALGSAALTAVDPRLLGDLGFQLSALATAGLVTLAPILARPLAPLPPTLQRPLAAWLASSLAAMLAVVPLIAAAFHSISVYTLLGNLLVLPAVPALMLLGAGAALVGWAAPPLAPPAGWPAWALADYVLAAARTTAALPGAQIFTGALGPLPLLLWYLGLALVAAWPTPEMGDLRAAAGRWLGAWSGRLACAVSGGLLVLGLTALVQRPDGLLHVTFIDGGAGVFVRGPAGRTILVDGGSSPTNATAAVAERLGFWERGLDVAAVGMGGPALPGLEAALARYPAALALAPPGGGRARQALDGSALVREAVAGDLLDLGDGVQLEVVRADHDELALRLLYGQAALYLPAGRSPVDLVATLAGSAVAVRWPGRGAPDDAALDRLRALRPEVVVASGAAAPALARALGPVAMVLPADQGTVELVSDGAGWRPWR